MPRPRPPYLRYDASRKWPWYVQKPGSKKHRLRDVVYGTDEFHEAYRIALDAIVTAAKATPKPTADVGTLEWGWQLYRIEAAEWKALSRATRRQRENIMTHVLAKSGAEKITRIDHAAVAAGVDRRKHTPSQAKNFLQTVRHFFQWLVSARATYPAIGIKADPTAGVKVKKAKTNGFLEWTEADIVKYELRWPLGTRQRVALDVYCYTGLRRGDAARVGDAHVSSVTTLAVDPVTGQAVPVVKKTVSLATEKSQGKTVVHLPLLDPLAASLAAGPVGKETWISTESGEAYAKESLGNLFKEWCVAAGVLDKSAHGLRKAAATRAADGGATTHELMAIFGWIDIKEAEIYTRNADRKRLAARAMVKLER